MSEEKKEQASEAERLEQLFLILLRAFQIEALAGDLEDYYLQNKEENVSIVRLMAGSSPTDRTLNLSDYLEFIGEGGDAGRVISRTIELIEQITQKEFKRDAYCQIREAVERKRGDQEIIDQMIMTLAIWGEAETINGSPRGGSGSLEMGHFNQQTGAELIKKAAAEFPEEFGLRGFPGKRFRFSEAASFITYNGDDFDHPVVMLYSQIFNEEESNWLDFAKGTPEHFRREVVSL